MKSKILFLVGYKVIAGLKSDASRTYLNFLWWIIEPAMTMCVYYFVFGLLLARGTEDFVIYLLCGLIPWLWFSKSVSNSMSSIFQARALIQQVNIQKWFFPAVTIGKDLVKQSIVIIIFLLFLLVYGVIPDIHWFAILPVLFVEFLLIVSVSFLVAAIVPFIPDLKFIISSGLQFLMFCSGVFYSLETIPEQYQKLFLLNPFAFILHSFRQALLWQEWPDWQYLAFIAGAAFLLLLIAVKMLNRWNKIYPRLIS